MKKVILEVISCFFLILALSSGTIYYYYMDYTTNVEKQKRMMCIIESETKEDCEIYWAGYDMNEENDKYGGLKRAINECESICESKCKIKCCRPFKDFLNDDCR